MSNSLVETPYEELTTFVDILRWHAHNQPQQCAYLFLNESGSEEKSITYVQLDQKARAIAAYLHQYLVAGERVLLLYPAGIEYIAAFMGCLYAGVIAVPVYPPSSNRMVGRVLSIVKDANAKVVLSTDQLFAKIQRWSKNVPELLALQWITTDDQPEVLAERWHGEYIKPQALAFLQYTSGSTGNPKGVMVSHGNLIHNCRMMHIHTRHSPQSVSVSWLPMFHDLGLIAGILLPLYGGITGILMAPTAFIQRPLSWLQAISRYRGTTSYAPNFAYELCINRITPEERLQLDLTSWRLAVNAAEPIFADTIERFASAFASCGFKREAMLPSYGLAETTLMVSSKPIETETSILHLNRALLQEGHVQIEALYKAEETMSVVGCGHTPTDQRVVIVDPETQQMRNQGEVGEIWVAGPSVAQGYWQQPQETEKIFLAYVKDTQEGPFVRTGDLGFVNDGQLYITGRLKDMVIIHGRNYYPQDIELTVEHSHPSLRPGCGAAFSIEVDNEERLVVVQEVVRHYEDPQAIMRAMRQAIAAHYEIRAYAVGLLRYGSILKTSSGKIQHSACRDAFLKNELLIVATDILKEEPAIDPLYQQTWRHQLQEATIIEKRAMLQALVTEQVRIILAATPEQQIDPEQNLLSLGMDSLRGTQIINRLESLLGFSLPNIFTSIMSEPTINKMASHLAEVLLSFNAPDAFAKNTLEEWLEETRTQTEDEAEAQLIAQLAAFGESLPASSDVQGNQEQEKSVSEAQPASSCGSMQFSLLYFSSHEAKFSENKYDLFLQGAQFADQHGFTAVWMPERHFHPFGGLYPNPAILASALAMVTQRIRLRAGSVVLPLHHPVLIAEEWATVDNLSAGRVDLAFALGWNPNDFVVAPTNYENRKEVLFSGIKMFQKLWGGDSIVLPNGLNKETTVRIYPLPRQPKLTPWITCTGNPERFIEAGAMGANILTGLLFQSQEELAEKISAYRAARARHGYDPVAGHVTLMMHTFVGQDMEEVRQTVRPAFIEYLRSSVDLWRNRSEKLDTLAPQEQEQVLAYAFERYFQTHGLFGTPQTCKAFVDRLRMIGVDEIACLIDFGIETNTVIDSLHSLDELQKFCQSSTGVQAHLVS